jgi:hypothetical protein
VHSCFGIFELTSKTQPQLQEDQDPFVHAALAMLQLLYSRNCTKQKSRKPSTSMFARKVPPPRTFIGGGGLVVSGTTDPVKQAQIERGDLVLTLQSVVKGVIALGCSGRGVLLGDSHRETIELCTAIYRIMTHHLIGERFYYYLLL